MLSCRRRRPGATVRGPAPTRCAARTAGNPPRGRSVWQTFTAATRASMPVHPSRSLPLNGLRQVSPRSVPAPCRREDGLRHRRAAADRVRPVAMANADRLGHRVHRGRPGGQVERLQLGADRRHRAPWRNRPVSRAAVSASISTTTAGSTGPCETGSEPGSPSRPPGITVGQGCGPLGSAKSGASSARASGRNGWVRPITRSRPRGW